MLVLSRHVGEEIVINGNISVRVVDIRGGKVRIGIEAPKEVPVHRREVFDAIQRNRPKPTAAPLAGMVAAVQERQGAA